MGRRGGRRHAPERDHLDARLCSRSLRIRRGRPHRNALVGLRRRRCASVRRGRRPEGRPLRRRSHLADRRAPACPRPAPRGLGRAAGARAQAAQAASERPIRGAAGRARAAQRSRHAARPPARDRGRSALRHACEADRLRRRQQRRRRNGRRDRGGARAPPCPTSPRGARGALRPIRRGGARGRPAGGEHRLLQDGPTRLARLCGAPPAPYRGDDPPRLRREPRPAAATRGQLDAGSVAPPTRGRAE